MVSVKRYPCPRCKGRMTKYPALSRRENTDICPPCGTEEALLDAGMMEKSIRIKEGWRHEK